MTRTRTDDLKYYSDEHEAMLRKCAYKTLNMFSRGTIVEAEDLMQDGWLGTLRRRDKHELKGTGTFTILKMLDRAIYAVTGRTVHKRKQCDAAVCSLESIAPDLRPETQILDEQFDPVRIAIERECNSLRGAV